MPLIPLEDLQNQAKLYYRLIEGLITINSLMINSPQLDFKGAEDCPYDEILAADFLSAKIDLTKDFFKFYKQIADNKSSRIFPPPQYTGLEFFKVKTKESMVTVYPPLWEIRGVDFDTDRVYSACFKNFAFSSFLPIVSRALIQSAKEFSLAPCDVLYREIEKLSGLDLNFLLTEDVGLMLEDFRCRKKKVLSFLYRLESSNDPLLEYKNEEWYFNGTELSYPDHKDSLIKEYLLKLAEAGKDGVLEGDFLYKHTKKTIKQTFSRLIKCLRDSMIAEINRGKRTLTEDGLKSYMAANVLKKRKENDGTRYFLMLEGSLESGFKLPAKSGKT